MSVVILVCAMIWADDPTDCRHQAGIAGFKQASLTVPRAPYIEIVGPVLIRSWRWTNFNNVLVTLWIGDFQVMNLFFSVLLGFFIPFVLVYVTLLFIFCLILFIVFSYNTVYILWSIDSRREPWDRSQNLPVCSNLHCSY